MIVRKKFIEGIFSQNFAGAKIRENKTLAKWRITLSHNTDVGKPCHSREFLTSQTCLLKLVAKIKPSRKFLKLQHIWQPSAPQRLALRWLARPRGYKTFSCSTQLSLKFQLLIKTKLPTNEEVSCLLFLSVCLF